MTHLFQVLVNHILHCVICTRCAVTADSVVYILDVPVNNFSALVGWSRRPVYLSTTWNIFRRHTHMRLVGRGGAANNAPVICNHSPLPTMGKGGG